MTISKRFLAESMTYPDYLEMVRQLLAQKNELSWF